MSGKVAGAVFALIFVISASGIAKPARPLYEPPAPPKAPSPAIVLEGTTWVGFLYANDERITFHANGTLTYRHGTDGGPSSPGSWKLTGKQLWFQVNQYSEYNTLVEGDTIHGPGTNKGGQKTQARLKRLIGPLPPLGPVP